MEAWMRVLTVTLTSHKLNKRFIFGANYEQGKKDLAIKATINKFMSPLKDEAVVEISNLTYVEITQIMMGEYYDIDIYAGYRKGNVNKVFSGAIFYISNKLNNKRTNTIVLICTSTLIAKYGQKRLNLTLNSGINLYSAIKFVARRAGITDGNISTQFKKQFLDNVTLVDANSSSWLDTLTSQYNTIIANSDSILNQTFSIFDAAKSNSRVIKLKPEAIIMTEGHPRLTNDGLNLSTLPTFNFMCGDTIQIDNSIIDISVTNKNQVTKNYAYQFSAKGQYMIYEMKYILTNRDSDFKLTLKCKNRDRISNYIGGVQ